MSLVHQVTYTLNGQCCEERTCVLVVRHLLGILHFDEQEESSRGKHLIGSPVYQVYKVRMAMLHCETSDNCKSRMCH